MDHIICPKLWLHKNLGSIIYGTSPGASRCAHCVGDEKGGIMRKEEGGGRGGGRKRCFSECSRSYITTAAQAPMIMMFHFT